MGTWKSDLDALINDTIAMVAAAQANGSVSGFAVARLSSTPEPPGATELPSHVRVDDARWNVNSEREEIRKRVASFKAHQEQWTRERENYASSILKGIDRRKE
jgi:uncharacterized protein YecA (UPF0149 family)